MDCQQQGGLYSSDVFNTLLILILHFSLLINFSFRAVIILLYVEEILKQLGVNELLRVLCVRASALS